MGLPLKRSLFSLGAAFIKHFKKDQIFVFPEMKLRGLVLNRHIYLSVNDLYNLTLGIRPRSFISGNICFEFSVQYLAKTRPTRHSIVSFTPFLSNSCLKVHKIENFFGFDFEICTFS